VFIYRSLGLAVLSAAVIVSPAAATRTHHAGSTAAHSASHVKAGRKSTKAAVAKSHKLHGQQAIAPERVTEIQQALIREHYLPGPANGEWDDSTVAAMQKYQSDQGWQTKLMPDSRALKKLGLGADYSNAINAKGSSFAAPPPVSTIPAAQAAGFTAASGVHQ
jgi:peptidoglycan hydrolase-like protein with peptidoglycan-binding domain